MDLVVMAAGMGSRFGGLKQAEPVGKNGEALVDYSVYDAVEAGFDKVVFVIKKAIEKDFKELVGNRIEKKVKVEYVFQEIDDLPEGYQVLNYLHRPYSYSRFSREELTFLPFQYQDVYRLKHNYLL